MARLSINFALVCVGLLLVTALSNWMRARPTLDGGDALFVASAALAITVGRYLIYGRKPA